MSAFHDPGYLKLKSFCFKLKKKKWEFKGRSAH
jgi:hypothetical protein